MPSVDDGAETVAATTSTRGVQMASSATEVPHASSTSSTRGAPQGAVPSLKREPSALQRRVTEKGLLGLTLPTSKGGATKDDVEREQRFHSKQVDKLASSMRSHGAEMRAKLADAQAIYQDITDHEVSLQAATNDTVDAATALKMFNEEMQGDFKLMKEKPLWNECVSDFLSAALGKNKDVVVSTPSLSIFLATCLEKAAPTVTPPAFAIVGFHPENHEMLKVFHASENAELKVGSNMRDLRDNTSSAVMRKVWKVLRTGEPDLNNAHGIDRDKGNVSLAPLKSTTGQTYGVVVTGPPPVPDELLEMMCRQAGPLLEQVWKLERAQEAIRNAVTFVKRYTIEQHVLVYAEFKEGKLIARPERADSWKWQPLVHNPNAPDVFELELKWRGGAPIGVVEVSCGNYTRMDEHLTMLLHVVGDVLLAAVEEIEDLTPGDTAPLKTVVQVLDEFERARNEAPKIILRESHQQLQHFDAVAVFGEISHFETKAVDDDLRAVLTGALCLMGVPRKKLGSWEACKKEFKNSRKCHEAMLGVMAGESTIKPADMKKRWTEFNMSIKLKGGKPVLNKALYDRSPVSVQLLIRWVTIARMEHRIEDVMAQEDSPAPDDPVADQIFDKIDTDNDGFLTAQELTAYLLKEFPTKVVHKTLRVLDTDQDEKISREEWRRGWSDGHLTQLLKTEQAKAKGDGAETAEKERSDAADATADVERPKSARPKSGAKKGGKKKPSA